MVCLCLDHDKDDKDDKDDNEYNQIILMRSFLLFHDLESHDFLPQVLHFLFLFLLLLHQVLDVVNSCWHSNNNLHLRTNSQKSTHHRGAHTHSVMD